MRKLALYGSALLAIHAEAAFANTLTTNYSLNKPTIGADANNWGNLDNANFDTIDATMFAISGVANAACPKSGCTYSGPVNFIDPMALTGAAGTTRRFRMQTGGVDRFAIYLDNSAEGGSNAGSLFTIGRYSDAGGYLDAPLQINRATGMVTFADGITAAVTGNASTASKWQTARTESLTGDLTGSASVDGSANWSLATTLATVNSAPGACGDATHVCVVTTNGKGLVTAQTATAIPTVTTSAAGLAPPTQYALFQYQTNSGVSVTQSMSGGTWNQLALNTTLSNTISGASLSGNQVPLPAGTYKVTGWATCGTTGTTGGFRLRLRDVTHATTLITGASNSSGNGAIQSALTVDGFFTLSATSNVELDAWASANMTCGGSTFNTGDPEVGESVSFQKIG